MRSRRKTTNASVPAVYGKGHLKRYSELLGLPAAEILAGYESRAQSPKPAAAPPTNVRLHTDTPPVSNLPWPQVLGSIVALLLLAGVWWWKPWHQRTAPVSMTSSAPASVAAMPADAVVPTAAASDAPPMLPSSMPAHGSRAGRGAGRRKSTSARWVTRPSARAAPGCA